MSHEASTVKIAVIIDANFILLPFQFKIDYLNDISLKLEEPIRFIIFKQVLDELEAKKIREYKATKFQRHLKSGLLYLDTKKENYDIYFLEDVKKKSETTDNFLLRISIQLKAIYSQVFLATNDALLRKEARESDIGTIFLRQKKYLSFERS